MTDDLAALRERFPGWVFEERWITAGTGPDRRHLLAHRGDVTVSGWTADDLRREIREAGG